VIVVVLRDVAVDELDGVDTGVLRYVPKLTAGWFDRSFF
jgi:hypothetical protein